eukprot:CAMPEP_0117453918 /NCGR_PEP_ID=MMETSP0759-20121206/10501_1 /TAXON_ID=63605 /ORGANISM="Percolomonas cosmopolitus, Strain WS" /LENGTH=287 /DNA_ID=CAMNT_0005247025 /DNA_START=98 /DNA_END=961 /DNA_ORIENTATION=+
MSLNPFRNVNLVPSNESRSSYHPHDDYDSESEEDRMQRNRQYDTLSVSVGKDTQMTYKSWQEELSEEQKDPNTTQQHRLKCGILVVASSKEATEFVSNFILPAETDSKECNVISIQYGEKSSEFVCVKKAAEGDVFVLTAGEQSAVSSIDPTQMMPIAQLLFHFIQAVIVLDSLPVHEFKSVSHTTEDLDMPMLFRMQTTRVEQSEELLFDSSTPYLPPSNILSGLGAAIMTYCEALDWSALMYVSLVESVRNVACIKAYSRVWKVEENLLKKPLKRRQNDHERLYM